MGFIQNIFSKLVGPTSEIKRETRVANYFTPYFASFESNIENSHVVMESVISITKHASKLKMVHYRENGLDGKLNGRPTLNRILQYNPNPTENGADFLEKAMYHWLISNNVFIFLKFSPGRINTDKEFLESMWVLDPYFTQVEVKNNGEIYLTFIINNDTERVTTSLDNIVMLKRVVGPDEFFGGSNDSIKKVLNIIDINYQGIENAIKSSAFIRFIVESVTVLSPDKRQKKAEEFTEEYLKASKNGGVIFSDAATKVTQVTSNSQHSNVEEMKKFQKSVYNYFGTNEKIIEGSYTDEEWNAFFESTIEPFINKLELEITKKIFTETELAYGNKIVVESNHLQKMSISSRLNIIEQTRELGLLTINEMRELIYLPPIEGGDKREVSLNYVDSDKQNLYQVGQETEQAEPVIEETQEERKKKPYKKKKKREYNKDLFPSVGKALEDYGNQNIPEQEEAFGKFMYFAELIKNGHIDIFLEDLKTIDEKYVEVVMEITKPLFQSYNEEEK